MKSILTHENELRNTEALETERPPSHTDPAKARPNPSGRARDRKWQGHAEEGRVQGRAFGPKGDFRSPKSHPTITPETIVVLAGTQEAPRRPRVEAGPKRKQGAERALLSAPAARATAFLASRSRRPSGPGASPPLGSTLLEWDFAHHFLPKTKLLQGERQGAHCPQDVIFYFSIYK